MMISYKVAYKPCLYQLPYRVTCAWGGGCVDLDAVDEWIIADGSSGPLLARTSSNVTMFLNEYGTADRRGSAIRLIPVRAGSPVNLNGNLFYTLDIFPSVFGVVTGYLVKLNNTPPRGVSNILSGVYQELGYVFQASDFGFSDADGDAFSGVRIDAQPSFAAVYVDANDDDTFEIAERVTPGTTVPISEIDAGNLQLFTLDALTKSFSFSVFDGIDHSTEENTFQFRGVPIPSVTLAIDNPSTPESDLGNNTVTARLSNAYGANTTVDLSIGGTATHTVDYTRSAASIVIPAGSTTGTLSLNNIDDAVFEPDETVVIDITNVTNGVESGTQQVTYTIVDDDEPKLSIAATNQAAEDANNGLFTVTTSMQFQVAIIVSIEVSGTATPDVDYSAIETSFIFLPNTNSVTISVPVIADDLDEPDETVIVTLTGTNNADVSIGPMNQATVTITDDDETPIVTASQVLAVPEDADNNDVVGIVVATDANAGTTFGNWSILSGDIDGIFTINPDNGELSIADNTNLDHETTTSYTLSVSVSDGSNASAPTDITINIDDVNDVVPVIDANLLFTITEGIGNGEPVGTVTATDMDVSTTTFQNWMIVSGNTSTDGDGEPPFAIDALSGEMTINDAGDINSSMAVFSLGVSVSDGVNTSIVETVVVNVISVNDAPSFTIGPGQAILEDAGQQTVIDWASNISPGPADESGQVLTFIVSNDNPALFSVPPSINANGDLAYTAATDQFGNATVTVMLTDDGGTANGGVDRSVAQTFEIYVASVNDQPSFVPGSNQTVLAGAADYTVAGWATDISAGPSNESSQEVTFNVTNDNNALFSAQPTINVGGALSFSINDGLSGNARVSVVLSDNGGTPNGGIDTSDEIMFMIEVGKIPQAITFSAIADRRVGQDPVALVATGGGSGLPVTFSINTIPASGVATLVGGVVIIEGAGMVNVTASQEGNEVYAPAPDVTQSFAIAPSGLFLPTLFTPNGDQTNDIFLLRGGGNVANIEFSIFDREGNIVFSSDSFSELSQTGWDGTHDGKAQAQGAYIWVVKGSFSDGAPLLINGKDTGIIRLAR